MTSVGDLLWRLGLVVVVVSIGGRALGSLPWLVGLGLLVIGSGIMLAGLVLDYLEGRC